MSRIFLIMFACLQVWAGSNGRLDGVIDSEPCVVGHVTSPGNGFKTDFIFEFPGDFQAFSSGIDLIPYLENGEALESVLFVPNAPIMRVNAKELFGNQPVSHLVVQCMNQDHLNVNVVYDYAKGESAPAILNVGSKFGAIWRLYPGNWDTYFDGITVINLEERGQAVYLVQKNFDGQILHQVTLAEELAPMAKVLFVVGAPKSTLFEQKEDSYFEVISTGHTLVTALRGTVPGYTINALWPNETSVQQVNPPHINAFEAVRSASDQLDIHFELKFSNEYSLVYESDETSDSIQVEVLPGLPSSCDVRISGLTGNISLTLSATNDGGTTEQLLRLE